MPSEVLDASGFQRGKIIKAGGAKIFYRDVSERVRIRFLDGWALEVAMVADLRRNGVDSVHYYNRTDKVLYAVSLDDLERIGVRRMMNGREQYLLPRRYWTKGLKMYATPWVTDRRDVEVRKEQP